MFDCILNLIFVVDCLLFRDKILTKVGPADARNLNMLRAQANELAVRVSFCRFCDMFWFCYLFLYLIIFLLQSNYTRCSAAPAAIDFAAYKGKLKFTGVAVDNLEKAFKNKKLPQYTANLPDFEVKKRAAIMNVVKSTVAAAQSDLVDLETTLESFETQRITKETSTKQFAKEIEGEIQRHEWFKDNDHGCT